MERWRKAWTEQDSRTKNWFLRWRERGADGLFRKRSLLCANYKDACAKRDIKNREMLESSTMTSTPHAELSPLLEQYVLDRTRVRKLRPGSIQIKRIALARYVEITKKVGNITRDSLIEYRDGLYSGLAAVTVGIRFREVKAFVRWLWHEGKLEQNPFFNIEMPRQEFTPHFITDAELIKIEGVASADFRKIFRMAYLTGMRAGELMDATWEQVSWVNGRAFITPDARLTKTRRARTIPLRHEIIELIGRKGSGKIFGFHKSSLQWAWNSAKKNAGITDRIRFHDLRHTFCRLYLQGGGTIADLMSITGHTSLSMMQVYAHFESRWRAERMDAMNLPTGLTGQITGQIQGSAPNLSVIQGDSGKLAETNESVKNGDSPTENDPENDGLASTVSRR